MISKTVEVDKFFGKNIVYEFHVETLNYDLNGIRIQINKWLQCLDWIQIYEKLRDCLSRCTDFNFNEIMDKEFQITNNIEIKLKITPLHDYYRKLFDLNQYNTIDKLLQIQVRKIRLEKYEEKINDLKKRIDMKNENSNRNNEKDMVKQEYEYDPLEVGNGINSDNHIPYKPSKLRCEGGEIKTERNIMENDPYSPQPLDDSMKLDMYLVCDENTMNRSAELSTETESQIPSSPNQPRKRQSEKNEESQNKATSSSSSSSSSFGSKKRALQIIEKKEYRSKRAKNQKGDEKKNMDLFGSDSDHEKDKIDKVDSGNRRYNIRPQKPTKRYCDYKMDDKNEMNEKSTPNKKDKDKRSSSKHEPQYGAINKWLHKSKNDKNCPSPSSSKNTKQKTIEKRLSPLKELEKLKKSEAKLEEYKTKVFRSLAMKTAIDVSKYNPDDLRVLNLHHYSSDKLINTYELFKPILDDLYETNSEKRIPCMPSKQQLLMCELVKSDDRLPMLRHLRDNYEKDFSTDEHTSVLMNIMLPEWILAIFMEEYHYEKTDAIKKIEMQNEIELSKPENIAKMCDHLEDEMKWYIKKKNNK